MQKDDLPGYEPDHPVSKKKRAVHGIVMPAFVEYVLDQLIPDHVPPRKQEAARSDVRDRVKNLVSEADFSLAINRPNWTITSYLRKHYFGQRPADLRVRKGRLPRGPALLQEYELVRIKLETFMDRVRSSEAISDGALAVVRKEFPELKWTQPDDSVRETPSETAHQVLATRYRVGTNAVVKALKKARRQQSGS